MLRSSTYPVIGCPPSFTGAAQVTSTEPSVPPGVAASVWGADGVLAPWAVAVLEYGPVPANVTAATTYAQTFPAPQPVSVKVVAVLPIEMSDENAPPLIERENT